MANIEHKNVLDPDIHEPKDVAAAISGQVYTADGAGGGAWAIQLSIATDLFEQTADKVVANTTTETTIIGTGLGSLLIPSARLIVGAHFVLLAQGLVSDVATPTFVLRAKMNGTEILTTGSQTLGAVSGSHWFSAIECVIRSEGVTGTLMSSGSFITEIGDHFGLTVSSPITIDTTIDQTMDLTVQWGTAAAGNTITSQLLDLRER